jgi:hypothetical protein
MLRQIFSQKAGKSKQTGLVSRIVSQARYRFAGVSLGAAKAILGGSVSVIVT